MTGREGVRGLNDVMTSPDLDPDLGLEATLRGSAPHPVAVLRAVGRRLLPSLIEATLVPTLLFYAVFALVGATGAFIAALGWSYVAIGRRLASRTPIPGIMILASIGITLRTAFAIASGSSFVYFVQPVLGTLVLSAVFVISVIIRRPLIGRFASDFCALEPGIASRPGVVRLYGHLTYLWAAVNLCAATATLVMLLTMPVGAFVAVRPVVCWLLTLTGIVITVSASVRAVRREGLLLAITSGGTLSAAVR